MRLNRCPQLYYAVISGILINYRNSFNSSEFDVALLWVRVKIRRCARIQRYPNTDGVRVFWWWERVGSSGSWVFLGILLRVVVKAENGKVPGPTGIQSPRKTFSHHTLGLRSVYVLPCRAANSRLHPPPLTRSVCWRFFRQENPTVSRTLDWLLTRL